MFWFTRWVYVNRNKAGKGEGCQLLTLNITGFVSIAPPLLSESHSPRGSKGLYERWLPAKEVLSLFMWIKANFFAFDTSKSYLFLSFFDLFLSTSLYLLPFQFIFLSRHSRGFRPSGRRCFERPCGALSDSLVIPACVSSGISPLSLARNAALVD